MSTLYICTRMDAFGKKIKADFVAYLESDVFPLAGFLLSQLDKPEKEYRF